MPRISVVVPTYNRKNMLLSAIRSVLNQTYKDFEIIVVDDGSGDGTHKAVKEIKDERVRYIRHEENRGSAAAYNTGINASEGSYIAFLNDDDQYHPDKLERQLKKLENSPPEVGLVYSGRYLFDNVGQPIGPILPSKSYWRGLSHPDFIGINPLVRKKCFENVGLFDENLHCYEDRDMWLRLSDHYIFAFVKEPLYKTRVHHGRSMSSVETRIEGLKRFHQKQTPRIKSASNDIRKDIFFRYRCELAKILVMKDSNYVNDARRESMGAIKLKPFSIEGYKLFVLSLLNRRLVRALSSLLRRAHIAAFWWYE